MKAKRHGKRQAKPTTANANKRRKVQAPVKRDDASCIAEQEQAIKYTKLWHETRDSAATALDCVSGRKVTYPRNPGAEFTEIVRTSLISSPDDSESAYRKGWTPEELFDQLAGCASLSASGHRRVLVRAYSWLVHDESEEVFDPQWITMIHKLSPDANNLAAAFSNAQMWLDRYLTELEFQVASKLLRFTKLEVVFWTQGPDAQLL